MDETYVKVTGQWKYLYGAVDRHGDTVDFLFSAKRDIAAARRFLERAIGLHGLPEKITIDKSGANTAAIESVIADPGAPNTVRLSSFALSLSKGEWASTSSARTANRTVLPRRTPPIASVQIPEQYRRTGSSIHQAHHPADAGLQILSLCSHPFGGNRNHASDSQGTVAQPKGPNAFRCRAVL